LADEGVTAEVVRLDGAVETAVTLGVADVIADVVETGTTLRSQGLDAFGEPILVSAAVRIKDPDAVTGNGFERLRRRILGVVTARSYVMLDYDCPVSQVERACRITPGLESPTVAPLHDKTWVAVRVMVPKVQTHSIMDQLYDIGAR